MAFFQGLYNHRAEIFALIVALDHALASTNKVKANSTIQLFLHSFIAAIQSQQANAPSDSAADAKSEAKS